MTAHLPVLALALALGACSSSAPAPMATDPTPRPHAPAPPGWLQHDMTRPAPPRVEPADGALPVAPPSDAVVLIGPDGSGLGNWQADGGGPAPWRTEGGALVVEPGTGGIRTTENFGDAQVHIEWMPAAEPEKAGQNRSNSGLFLADGRYEVQILDVWENDTYSDGRAGAIYGQFPPLADATRPPDEWQALDVFFRLPRFSDDGTLLEEARMTVVHNGVLVQNNEVLPGTTIWLESLPYEPHGPGRIGLQDHGSAVRFRNLWVRRIPERPAPPAGYATYEAATLTAAERDRLVGRYARDEGGTFVIERVGDGLGLSMPWRPGVLPIIPLSPTSLQLENTAGRFEVELDDAGAVAGLAFTMGGATYHATPE
ncbi:family 16 glycoside hydrolase [Rubrivirga sp.]|uniref:3-keto-disaccharide hydrolase n=1 Tax=Rubrivirga sp. TaxID=1885344 RepID=UPI003B526974